MTNITQAEGGSANTAIVIGASSKIAIALIQRLSSADASTNVVAISRQFSATASADFGRNVTLLQSDYTDKSIRDICEQLKLHKGQVSQVFICNGILHNADISPEKRVDDIGGDNLHGVFQVNAVIPMLWVKYLKPVLAGKGDCVVTAFSARIGSIEDNQRGGWYSYRASKAALNMLLKTAAIEYTRIAKGVRFLVFHPGTTDTPLSKPFQKFVSEGKLFTPEFVADRLLGLVEAKTSDNSIQFIDWDGKSIPW
jgi:NAD(P)-dependent dehydrogenase (short-subunit alcohol dehydrogenase family)